VFLFRMCELRFSPTLLRRCKLRVPWKAWMEIPRFLSWIEIPMFLLEKAWIEIPVFLFRMCELRFSPTLLKRREWRFSCPTIQNVNQDSRVLVEKSVKGNSRITLRMCELRFSLTLLSKYKSRFPCPTIQNVWIEIPMFLLEKVWKEILVSLLRLCELRFPCPYWTGCVNLRFPIVKTWKEILTSLLRMCESRFSLHCWERVNQDFRILHPHWESVKGDSHVTTENAWIEIC